MSAFSEFDHHQFSDSVPFSSWSFVVSRIPTSFLIDPGPRNDQRLAGNLFANKDKCGVSNTFLFSVFSSPYDVIEHRHEDNSSLGLRWVAHFVYELLNFVDELQCSESLEIFHSNFIGSPSIVSKVRCCSESLNQPSQTVFKCWVLVHLSKT